MTIVVLLFGCDKKSLQKWNKLCIYTYVYKIIKHKEILIIFVNKQNIEI